MLYHNIQIEPLLGGGLQSLSPSCSVTYDSQVLFLLIISDYYFFISNRIDKNKSQSFYTDYIPSLPVEGREGELEDYRNITQEMIVLINVRTTCTHTVCTLIISFSNYESKLYFQKTNFFIFSSHIVSSIAAFFMLLLC